MTLRDLLVGESQDDSYTWSAVFAAHAYLALGPWGLIAIATDKWTAAWVTPVLYLVIWEGIQLAISEKRSIALIWDSVLDTVAVAFACYAAACMGYGHQMAAIGCWGASLGVMAAGWSKRA